MTESQQTEQQPGEAADVPAQTSAKSKLARLLPAGPINAGVILGALALVLVLALWVDSRGRSGRLEQDLGKKLGEMSAEIEKARVFSAQAQEATKDAQVKLGVLENKLAESQAQQVALETLYQELSRNRDEWVLAEVEQVLFLASEQLLLTGNVKAALVALQTADSRLARLDKPQFIPLRKAVVRDIERLQTLPAVDVAGISLKLDNLVAQIDALPLQFGDQTLPERPVKKGAKKEESTWDKLSQEIWSDFKQLVRIRNMDKPDAALLTPSQEYFLRENLKLRLLTARIALFQRNEPSYKADLKAAETWLAKHYDTKAKATQSVLAGIRQLAGSPVSIELPDIAGSLKAAQQFRVSKDRGGR
jgi:uroporphyrin-3 C-methyltransferase